MTPTEDLGSLSTEAADPRYADLDQLPVLDVVRLMNQADLDVPRAVGHQLPAIAAAIEATAARMQQGGRLVYVGAGTPGRIGVLDASECPPTFGTSPDQVQAIIAGGLAALVSPVEGAEDDRDAGARAMDDGAVGALDTVVGIASSGRTPFVLAAVDRARERGALTIGLSCNRDTALSAASEHAIEVQVGPEVITGSTRLKAGTAQKLVLNMLSTVVMVRLGKTYGGLMVDLQASNHKLRERALRIVTDISGADRHRAAAVLTAVDHDVKVATTMLVHDESAPQARSRLQRADGRLRTALEGS